MPSEESILVNITPMETRVAWVDNGILREVWIERANKRGLVGNIYLGKVERVLPGMQAAFINIGLERTGFLHVSDICPKTALSSMENMPEDCDDITKFLRAGQKVVVQVVKNPLSSKGARLTMLVTIPSRLLVFMPEEKMIGVSQRIDSREERERLRELIHSIPEAQSSVGGFIVRTVAEGAGFHEIRADIVYLEQLWSEIIEKQQKVKVSALLYEDQPLYLNLLRDIPVDNLKEIQVDSFETHKKMLNFSNSYVMNLANKLVHYSGESPLFDLHNIEEEIKLALNKRVNLKSGGYLIIDQTEAMTTVDVNTGGFVGHKNLEETIFRTNLEATKAIARQLRLRNLGGIIILDLIDMDNQEHRTAVYSALQKELLKDKVKMSISAISNLGLIEMTRKITRESLERVLCEPCDVCQGRGSVKTAETISFEVFREITRMAKQFEAKNYRVIASESVASYILDEASNRVVDLEVFLNKNIRFQAESGYFVEQFDVVMS